MPGLSQYSKMSTEKLKTIGVLVANELVQRGEQSAFLYYKKDNFHAAGHGPMTRPYGVSNYLPRLIY